MSTWNRKQLRDLAAYIIHDHGPSIAGIEETNDDFVHIAEVSFPKEEADLLTDDDLDTVREMIRGAVVEIEGERYEGAE